MRSARTIVLACTKRLLKNLRQISDRAAKGAHGDVTPDEAKALFLQTYLTLGEIILASQPNVLLETTTPTRSSDPFGHA